MTKKAKGEKLQLLRDEYLLMHELHQLLVHGGRAALRNNGLCNLSNNLRWAGWIWIAEPSFGNLVFKNFIDRIDKHLAPDRAWLFKPGTVKPRIKWLEEQMETVKVEGEKLLAG